MSNHVGFDPAGQVVLDALDIAGVRHWAISPQASDTNTPQVIVVTDEAGTRTWFAWLGPAVNRLAMADLTPLNAARLAYIDCYRVIESAAMIAISATAVPLMLNLGDDPLIESLAAATRGRHVAFLQTSLDETHVEQAEQLADDLYSRVVADNVVITLGRHRALALTATKTYRAAAPTITVRHIPRSGCCFLRWPCPSSSIRCHRP